MASKFRAATMLIRLRPLLLGLALLAVVWPRAGAERADRTKEMVIEGDKSGSWDMQRQVMVWTGNVTIAQGTMLIRAERVELRELPSGFRAATAIGATGRQASYRQKRDNLDEFVEGFADRIEFDGRADTVRFVGNGVMRQLRGGVVANEVAGQQLLWANASEQFTVEGGNRTAANPSGRVRAVLSPPSEAASAAPATATPAATGGLRPSRVLPDPR
jgi:lipopolysaccharide export system protein LptA